VTIKKGFGGTIKRGFGVTKKGFGVTKKGSGRQKKGFGVTEKRLGGTKRGASCDQNIFVGQASLASLELPGRLLGSSPVITNGNVTYNSQFGMSHLWSFSLI
jgi:hypothetical protein